MASPQGTDPRTVDLRPELPADVALWTPERWADYYRTVNHRAGFFRLMVSARGLEDETAQQAWTALARAIQGAE